jgi:branched-chain amino acid transport system ATP-binding protein
MPFSREQKMMVDPLLRIVDLHVAYGKAEVVHGVSLTISAAEYVALLGPNGAGKSTILHAVSGLIPKTSGSVWFDGEDISRATARDIVKKGLVQVLEGHRVFRTLSVEDNLLLSLYECGIKAKGDLDRIFSLFPELKPKRKLAASQLSGGQQQILAVAQGIIVRPRLLILDEPSLGLAPLVVDRILDAAAQLAKEGTAILLVEQAVEKALARSHRACILNAGHVVHSAPTSELIGTDVLHKSYMGRGT